VPLPLDRDALTKVVEISMAGIRGEILQQKATLFWRGFLL